MGFFRNVGRRAEKLKQQVTDAAHEEARAECRECGAVVYTDRETCPECGHDTLEVTEQGESAAAGETRDAAADEESPAAAADDSGGREDAERD